MNLKRKREKKEKAGNETVYRVAIANKQNKQTNKQK